MRLLSFIFILLLASTAIVSQTPTERIAATWQVVSYDIAASLPANESDRNLTAKATIRVRNVTDRPATSLTFRINQNAEIASASVNGAAIEAAKSQERLGGATLQRVALRVPAVAAGGELTAVIDYKIPVADNTGVNSISPVASHFLPLSFWYPTPNSWFFARGADYAPFKIRLTAPAGLTAISAGTESTGAFESKLNGQPFVAAGSWDRVDSSGIAVHIPKGSGELAKARAAELATLLSEAKAFTEKTLGPVPNVPLWIVAMRRGGGFSTGGTVLIDEAVFRRQKIDSLTAMNIAEAAAKLWLGEANRLTDDGSGVIREGLARYLATKFIATKYGAEVAEVEVLRQRIAYAAIARRDAPLNTVTPLDDHYFAAVANKGAMFWRVMERKVGTAEFNNKLRASLAKDITTLAGVRREFEGQKEVVDYMLDQVTDMNLQAGLPQAAGGEWKVALRNTGPIDVTVDVAARLENGETLSAPVTIKAKSFGEMNFRTPSRIVRVEIDPEKLYPQNDYSDDIAPREFTDSDLLLAVKREFDRQEFATAEKNARQVLAEFPRFDDVRVLLGRSLLAQNKISEADREFRAVLAEPLPTSRSIGWANVGVADVALRTNRNADAAKHATDAIIADAEYGAGLAARNVRTRITQSSAVEDAIKAFFVQFDRAAISNRKSEVDALAVPGEVNRFVSGISGQATVWTTTVLHADMFDANTAIVETNLSVRLLTREPETGTAVFRLLRTGTGWKLAGVEIFEVR